MATTASPYLTPAQLLAQAKAIADQEVAGSRVPIDQQAATADQQSQAHGSAIQGFSSSLADILGSIQPQVQGAYDDASGRTATFAKGYSDGLQLKLKGAGDQTNQFLTNVVGAPAGQLTSPDTATAIGDSVYGAGGYIPASTLAREGAAYSAAAGMLPAYARLKGQQDYTSNLFAGRDEQTGFANQIAALTGQEPKLINDIYAQLADLQVKNKAQDTNDQIARANLGLSAARLGESSRHDKALESAASTNAQLRALSNDRNYQLAVARLGISAAAERRAEKKANTQRAGLTPAKLNDISTQAEKDAESFYFGVPAETRADGSVAKPGAPPRQYKQALQAIVARYPGLGPKRAIKILDSLYAPGEGGRPALSAKQQSALDAALNPVDTLIGSSSALGGP